MCAGDIVIIQQMKMGDAGEMYAEVRKEKHPTESGWIKARHLSFRVLDLMRGALGQSPHHFVEKDPASSSIGHDNPQISKPHDITHSLSNELSVMSVDSPIQTNHSLDSLGNVLAQSETEVSSKDTTDWGVDNTAWLSNSLFEILDNIACPNGSNDGSTNFQNMQISSFFSEGKKSETSAITDALFSSLGTSEGSQKSTDLYSSTASDISVSETMHPRSRIRKSSSNQSWTENTLRAVAGLESESNPQVLESLECLLTKR